MEPQANTEESSARETAPSYVSGLDGLRALSVLAVFFYHANTGWLPGGFLGVEIFFVISGFIITRSLVLEWLKNGRIAITAFWLRRARRLLPALFLLLAGVLTYATFFDQDGMTRLRSDVLYALGYVTNWHLIYSNQSYFDSWNQPTYLRHLWSLAIEEQFYLLWPLLLAAALKFFKAPATFVLILIGACWSYAAMALLAQGQDETGINRVYYGTDTRIGALLVGSAIGFLPLSSRLQLKWPASRLTGVASICAVIILGFFIFRMSDKPGFAYEGGFALTALATATLILALNNPRSLASRALGFSPLRWIGVRSYGIYLYHFPILLLTWPDMTASLGVLALQLLATLVIADLSYRYLELPIRRGFLTRAYRALSERRAGWRQGFAAGFVVTSVAMVVAGLTMAAISATPPRVPEYLQATQIRLITPGLAEDVASLVQRVSPAATAEAGAPPETGDPSGPASPPEPAAEPPADPADDAQRCATIRGRPYESAEERDWYLAHCVNQQATGGTATTPLPTFAATGTIQVDGGITAIGDSVMVGAGPWLAANFAGLDIDAAVGRQVSQAVSLLRQRRDEGTLARNVLLHIGNNGTFTASQFDQIMEIAGPDRRVFFINVHVPRSWEEANNRVISQGADRYPNAYLIDWAGTVAGHDELFAADGVHIAARGASIYTGLVVQALTR